MRGMKAMMCLFFCCAACCANAWGSESDRGWSIEPLVGVQWYNYGGQQSLGCRFRAMANGGIRVERAIVQPLSLSAGIEFNTFGARLKRLDNGYVRQEHLSLPITINLRAYQGLKFYMGFAPTIALHSSMKSEGVHRNADDVVKRADLLVPLGIRYEFDNGITLDARYQAGCFSMLKRHVTMGDYELNLDGAELHNMSVGLCLGYRFAIK